MTINPREIFAQRLAGRLNPPRAAEARAPANIALAKYWGKRDKALNLPMNSSLSISLARWGTRTRIAPSDRDQLHFNGQALSTDDPAAKRIWEFVNLYRQGLEAPLAIETDNTIPTAAGLASSASGFAALTRALDIAFASNLALETLSELARFGSGSATRSFWHGFVRWDRGAQADGSDSFARLLPQDWPEFRIALLPVDTGPKAQSSRQGMGHTFKTSPLYTAWPDRAEADCAEVQAQIKARDFNALGRVVEANALAMHATMLAARPALSYLQPSSWSLLERLWIARSEGLEAYATADAGPNIKLIFLAESQADVLQRFSEAKVVAPFDVSGGNI
ncbi:MAG: diphosphomevalonate decarboxylase [Pseudomonadota bacterium]